MEAEIRGLFEMTTDHKVDWRSLPPLLLLVLWPLDSKSLPCWQLLFEPTLCSNAPLENEAWTERSKEDKETDVILPLNKELLPWTVGSWGKPTVRQKHDKLNNLSTSNGWKCFGFVWRVWICAVTDLQAAWLHFQGQNRPGVTTF